MRSVSTTRHISTIGCQSRRLRAKRETSRAATAPTLPRQTSATMRSNPARGPAGGRAAEVLVDDLDLRPAELREPVAHGVLEPLALAVVLNLMSGGLTDVEHRLAGPVLGADLVSAHCRRPRVGCPAFERRWRARRAGGSEAPSASAASAPAERTKPAE